MADPVWYLGPLGDLKALPCPEMGINTTVTRYGGVHQGLSGSRTMDVTGFKESFDFTWEYMEKIDWAWLNAVYTRHVPGPHRLINPMKVNRLSIRGASVLPGTYTNTGFFMTSGSNELVYDYPTSAGYGARSLKWSGWSNGASGQFDLLQKTPVFPLEQITCSIWMKAGSSITVPIVVQRWDRSGQLASSAATNCSVTTTWTKFNITDTMIAGATSAVFAVTPPNYTTALYLAAAQVETGASATTWEDGGGAPEVLIDQMSTNSPRFPLTDCAMTLLEA